MCPTTEQHHPPHVASTLLQVAICRHGLYTLLAATHSSADPARSAAARAILTNIHYHPGNATTLYKAELKLKYAALISQHQGSNGSGSSSASLFSSSARGGSPAASRSAAGCTTAAVSEAAPVAVSTPRAKTARSRSSTVALAMQQLTNLSAAKEAAAASPPPSPGPAAQAANGPAIARGARPLSGTPGTTATMAPAAASKGALAEGAGAGAGDDKAMDAATIEARLSFLKWVVDPRARSSGAAAVEGGADAAAAAATGLDEGTLLAQLTADPEELRWLETVRVLQEAAWRGMWLSCAHCTACCRRVQCTARRSCVSGPRRHCGACTPPPPAPLPESVRATPLGKHRRGLLAGCAARRPAPNTCNRPPLPLHVYVHTCAAPAHAAAGRERGAQARGRHLHAWHLWPVAGRGSTQPLEAAAAAAG